MYGLLRTGNSSPNTETGMTEGECSFRRFTEFDRALPCTYPPRDTLPEHGACPSSRATFSRLLPHPTTFSRLLPLPATFPSVRPLPATFSRALPTAPTVLAQSEKRNERSYRSMVDPMGENEMNLARENKKNFKSLTGRRYCQILP